MSKHIGIIVSPKTVELVRLIKNASATFSVEDFRTIKVPVAGNRPSQCKSIYDQTFAYLSSKDCAKAHVVIKGSAATRHAGIALLLGAEIRALVLLAIAATGLQSTITTGMAISKIKKGKKTADYLKDEEYWKAHGLLEMPRGAREAALLVTTEA